MSYVIAIEIVFRYNRCAVVKRHRIVHVLNGAQTKRVNHTHFVARRLNRMNGIASLSLESQIEVQTIVEDHLVFKVVISRDVTRNRE